MDYVNWYGIEARQAAHENSILLAPDDDVNFAGLAHQLSYGICVPH